MTEEVVKPILEIFVIVGAVFPPLWIAFGPKLAPIVDTTQQDHVAESNLRRAWRLLPSRIKRSGILPDPTHEVRHGPPTS